MMNTENKTMHVGLNVSNIEKTLKFYEVVFDQKADKIREGYAKFILPELIISFIETPNKPDQNFGHLGFSLTSSEEVTLHLERIEKSGIDTLTEEQVKCCYALQDKFWVTDPDGFRWEFYHFQDDVESNDKESSSCCPEQSTDNESECCTNEQKAEAAECC